MKLLEKYLHLIFEYQRANKSKSTNNFEYFSIISDTFYKENFHSDILKVLLEFEPIYLEFINTIAEHKDISISNFKFQSSKIYREKGRIDVAIVDGNLKEVIIIENKINNAGDTHRQLPKYYDYWIEKEYVVKSIIYLTFNGTKSPNQSTWNEKDIKTIPKLVFNLSAIKTNKKISLTEILERSLQSESDIEKIGFVRQYIKLLSKLSINELNFEIMEKFLQELLKNQKSFNEVKAIAQMYYELPKYRARKIIDYFQGKTSPFESVEKHTDFISFFNVLNIGESNFAIDIECGEDNYCITFFDRNSDDNKTAVELSKKLILDFYEIADSQRLNKNFKFPEQENEFYQFIEETLEKLNNNSFNT